MSPVRTRLVVASLAAVVLLALATAWAFEISLERALVLAPVLVAAAGLVAAVGVLLVRAAIVSVRESGHPRLVVAVMAGLTALAVVLTILGVELPRE